MSDEARRDAGADRQALHRARERDYQTATTASTARASLPRHGAAAGASRLESSIASYQTGSVDFLSVLTNFGTVLEYEMTYFDELASFHVAVSRLEEVTGATLVH